MQPMHTDPHEAVQIHLDVRSARSVPIHWATFILTREAIDEPAVKLERACEELGVRKETFREVPHGETIEQGAREAEADPETGTDADDPRDTSAADGSAGVELLADRA